MAAVLATFYFVATVSVSAKTTTIGTEVFDASATDPDSSQVFYNKTCSPDPCPFEINGGTRTFKKNLTVLNPIFSTNFIDSFRTEMINSVVFTKNSFVYTFVP